MHHILLRHCEFVFFRNEGVYIVRFDLLFTLSNTIESTKAILKVYDVLEPLNPQKMEPYKTVIKTMRMNTKIQAIIEGIKEEVRWVSAPIRCLHSWNYILLNFAFNRELKADKHLQATALAEKESEAQAMLQEQEDEARRDEEELAGLSGQARKNKKRSMRRKQKRAADKQLETKQDEAKENQPPMPDQSQQNPDGTVQEDKSHLVNAEHLEHGHKYHNKVLPKGLHKHGKKKEFVPDSKHLLCELVVNGYRMILEAHSEGGIQ